MTPRSVLAWLALLTVAVAPAWSRVRAQPEPESASDSTPAPESEKAEEPSTRSESPPGSETTSPSHEGDGPSRGSPSEAESGSAPPPPSDPDARLKAAERAFKSANFDRLPRLLEPLFEPEPAFDDRGKRVRSRELLGVGYFFAAQQSTQSDRRDALLEAARTQFWKLLQMRPDYSLDPLTFPASVVELFESVRKAHADELAELRQKSDERQTSSKAAGETLYIERRVETHSFALNFFPFGVGQFQNGSPVKGSLFAAGQMTALGVNTAGFVAIEDLRNANGRFEVGPDRTGGDFALARRWRRIQYAAIGVFGAVYIGSIVDAILEFERRRIHIRTRDEPPPELSADDAGTIGKSPTVRIGWGHVRVRW